MKILRELASFAVDRFDHLGAKPVSFGDIDRKTQRARLFIEINGRAREFDVEDLSGLAPMAVRDLGGLCGRSRAIRRVFVDFEVGERHRFEFALAVIIALARRAVCDTNPPAGV